MSEKNTVINYPPTQFRQTTDYHRVNDKQILFLTNGGSKATFYLEFSGITFL